MKTIAAVAVGGALGSVLRYLLSSAVTTAAGRQFPFGTLVVNVLGGLAIGLLYVWLHERSAPAQGLSALLIVGLLGGFTTFSAFSLETFALLGEAAYVRALANVVLSVFLCVAATALGVFVARQF